uniref:Uncharacterized protein n=1 Tax=Nothoprocta perdicaria TaxID=30464 RepID=A0A8C6ZTD9_NOTPE
MPCSAPTNTTTSQTPLQPGQQKDTLILRQTDRASRGHPLGIAHCSPELLGSSDPAGSASPVAGTTGAPIIYLRKSCQQQLGFWLKALA